MRDRDAEVVLVNLLFEPPTDYGAKKESYQWVQRRPQLGLQYLAAVLREAGIQVALWDQYVDSFSLEQFLSRIKGRTGLVGFYSHNFLVDKLRRYIAAARPLTEARLVVGGPGAIHAEEYLDAGADAVVRGEAETVVVDLVRFARGEKPLSDIPSVTYKRDGALCKTPDAALIPDLDVLPFPDRSLLPLTSYYDYFLPTLRLPYATLMTSRGCPYSCGFCGSPVQWGHKVRQRSVENVLAEVDELTLKHGVRYLTFEDDIFGLRRSWTEEFLSRLTEQRRSLKWMCVLHPLSFRGERREKVVSLFAAAGCDLFSFGLQSADPKVLEKAGRFDTEPDSLAEMIRLARSHGILTSVDFIFGLPGSSPASLQRDIEWIDRVRPDMINAHCLVVMRGTPFAENGDAMESGVSSEEARASCRTVNRRFYGNPATAVRLASKILRANPRWLLSAPSFLRAYLGAVA